MASRRAKVVCFTALLVAGIAAAALNICSLNEAYGSGPPYYSRTTNMDKWSDPLPTLTVIDTLVLLAGAGEGQGRTGVRSAGIN